MALATICPHCHTTFRVASDQLKLRGGIVRCGACNEVFDGAAALVDLDAIPVQPPAPAAADAGSPAVEQEAQVQPERQPDFRHDPKPQSAPDADADPFGLPDAGPQPDHGAESLPILHSVVEAAPETPVYQLDFDTTLDEAPAPAAATSTPAPDRPDEPAADEHLVALPPPEDFDDDEDLAAAPAPSAVTPPAPPSRPRAGAVDSLAPLLTRASAAAEDRPGAPLPAGPAAGPSTLMQAGQAKTARRNAAAEARKKAAESRPAAPIPASPPPPPVEDEPEFVRSSRLREETGATRRRLMGVGAAVLALLLLAQSVSTFRNVLAARYPAARPALAGACAVIGCRIELPAQIDALAVETGELQALDANGTFSFTTLLRNQGELVQAWPHLELDLTDANDKPLVRRVFTPADYLPPGSAPAKGFAARSEQPVKLYFQLNQIKASGYHLAIFYP